MDMGTITLTPGTALFLGGGIIIVISLCMFIVMAVTSKSQKRKMEELRYNAMNITSAAAFARIKGGTVNGRRDIYFIRLTGADSSYGTDIENMDRLLSGEEGQSQTGQDPAVSQSVPEAVQAEGTEILELENLPAYNYRQQEIELENQGQRIYGVAYIPDTEEDKVPLVICAHGLGGSYRSNAAYAEQLASHGIAAYCFDFRGGGGSRSEGDTTEMSVMTEVSDLEVVIEVASEWDFVDESRIALLGTSQGGIVSAITAARHTDRIAGLVLMYPAFLISDAVHEQFASLEEVPDSYRFNWITAGRPYAEDMWDYDVYEEIGNYTDKVLLLHGSADSIVPVSYSDRAAEVYSDVEYHVIDGAGHGFSGTAFDEAVRYVFDYLQQIEII